MLSYLVGQLVFCLILIITSIGQDIKGNKVDKMLLDIVFRRLTFITLTVKIKHILHLHLVQVFQQQKIIQVESLIV
jgi:hypothetical protein